MQCEASCRRQGALLCNLDADMTVAVWSDSSLAGVFELVVESDDFKDDFTANIGARFNQTVFGGWVRPGLGWR